MATKSPKKLKQPKAKPRFQVGVDPLPKFASEEEEVKFWHAHEVNFPDEDSSLWEDELPTRDHVLRVRMNELEMAALKRFAKRRGLSQAAAVRTLLLEGDEQVAAPEARRRGR